jgi:8-oxo-dGTP diphosphatase
MEYVDVVAGVIWRNGRFVATQRVRGKHAGSWEFPGGKVKKEESNLSALARELYEELNITLEEAHYWRTVHHSYGERHIRLHVYHVLCFSGEPRAMEKQILRWWTGPEACGLPFLEADMPLLRELAGVAKPAPLPDLAAAFGWVSPLLETSPAM